MTSLAVPSSPLTSDQYRQYALEDPGYVNLKASLQGNEDAYRAQARGGINRGVIALGLAPTDSSLSGWLDPGTAAAASANPLSTAAGEKTQHLNNLRSLQNNLAARGAYDSGELTYGLGNENQRDTQANADAMGKFLDYANGLFGNLGSMQAADAGQLGSELGNAAMRQLALHPGTTTSATWDDASGTYVDSSGNHYDQYGNHIGTASADGSAPPPTTFGSYVPGATQYASGVSDFPQINPTYAPTTSVPYTPPDQPITTQFSPFGGASYSPAGGTAPVNVYNPTQSYKPGQTNTAA